MSVAYSFGVHRELFSIHESENVRLRPGDVFGSKHCLFMSWSRVAQQAPEEWYMESRISRGTPYSVETSKDPRDLQLGHDHYQRLRRTFRPYSTTFR